MDGASTLCAGVNIMIETITTLFSGKSGIVLLIILGILAFATLIVSVIFRTKTSQELKDRVYSWWIIIGAFILGAMLNTTVAMFFFALISYLALKEYFTLIPTRRTDRRIIFYAYLSIVFQYWFAGAQWYGMFIIWIPVYLFLLLPFRQVFIGETQGFLENTSRVQWGLMMFVFGLSHLAYMMTLPAVAGHDVGGKELVLYLVVLTELNDVLQYLWGKAFGKHKIVPKVSPNKTIEGFVGAFVTLSALAVAFRFSPLLRRFKHSRRGCSSAARGSWEMSSSRWSNGTSESKIQGIYCRGMGGYLIVSIVSPIPHRSFSISPTISTIRIMRC
jgi:phosphatidate cytidylyltransferase